MNLQWFFSSTVRRAVEMSKHVRKILAAQRDLLAPNAITEVEGALAAMKKTLAGSPTKDQVAAEIKKLEETANKWLRPYPNAEWRENIEVMLVAITVAMAVRTFFLQPFKIPTGSMQPTLYGITMENMKNRPDVEFPKNPFTAFLDGAVRGVFYHELYAEEDGVVVKVGEPEHLARFINKQSITMAYRGPKGDYTKNHTLWFTPDERFRELSGLHQGQTYRKGEPIIKVIETAGDHLFVDRLTYNFRHPKIGEIIVFKTAGIEHPSMRQDQFYIKRLVAEGGQVVQVGDDQHLRINGTRLDASTPFFDNVYTFNPVPEPNHYFGHVNEEVARRLRLPPGISPFFPSGTNSYTVRPNHYMVMGDNTLNSFDSRGWGDFPRTNVIGRSWFVYWPISNHGSSRFGWSHH